ncbi:DUF4202 family protein [Candidatus Woesearchaeota archaeon]|nr:DUF4202 family protein [Candidatus Woesearchaeota archaeon]
MLLQSPAKTDWKHAQGTKNWILKLRPDADFALQIAALAHDIERGFYKKSKEDVKDYNKHKAEHAKRSAQVISDILVKHKFDEIFVKRVAKLILLHEVGGNPESNDLRDSDSISFFEDNLEQYFEKFGTETTIKKIKYMFGRMNNQHKKHLLNLTYPNTKLDSIFGEIVRSYKK